MKSFYKTLLAFAALSILGGNISAQETSDNNFIKRSNTTSISTAIKKSLTQLYNPRIKELKQYKPTNYNTLQPSDIFKSVFAQLKVTNSTYGKDFITYSYNENNAEYIIGVALPSIYNRNIIKVVKLKKSNGIWKIYKIHDETRYYQDYNLTTSSFASYNNIGSKIGEFKEVSVKGIKYIQFDYINYTSGITDQRTRWINRDTELITNMIALSDLKVFNTLFSGELLDGAINGTCADLPLPNTAYGSYQVNYLLSYFSTHPDLAPVNRSRDYTKELLHWWYDNNPQGSTAIKFGVLPSDSSIITSFQRSQDKQSIGNFTVSLLDIIDTHVFCVYNKSTRKHYIVWCEPKYKNNTEPVLNGFVLNDENLLEINYTNGNDTITECINLDTRRKQ